MKHPSETLVLTGIGKRGFELGKVTKKQPPVIGITLQRKEDNCNISKLTWKFYFEDQCTTFRHHMNLHCICNHLKIANISGGELCILLHEIVKKYINSGLKFSSLNRIT